MNDYIDIRISEAGNKLAFRYDPRADVIQVSIRGYGKFEVRLDDYRHAERQPLTQNGRSAILCAEGPR